MGKEDDFEEYWEKKLERRPDRDKKQVAYTYIERNILDGIQDGLLIAIDEADRIFPYQEVSDEFFLMLRSWHEGANTNSTWEKFKIAISYSTEAKLAITNLNASPFNVGEEARLYALTIPQVTQLTQSHGLDLGDKQIQQLQSYLGGHPYLIRRALFSIATQEYSFDNLIDQAASDQGPFSDHLRHHLFNIKQFEDLSKALKVIIQTQKCNDPIQANRPGCSRFDPGNPPRLCNGGL